MDTCPACHEPGARPSVDFGLLPANGTRPFPTREAALAEPRGRVRLAACGACGFVFNAAFDPSLVHVGPDLEETQASSPTFVRFQRELAADLVRRHRLHGGTVLEIGCGKGEFLALAATLADGVGIGFDPAFVTGRAGAGEERIRVERRLFGPDDARRARADLVVCKMTLEHMGRPGDLVDLARAAAEAVRAPVVFTVPEALHLLRCGNPFEVHHEHAGYFTPGSLARLLRTRGLAVEDLRILYGGQILLAEARPADGPVGGPHPLEETPEEAARAAAGFEAAAEATIDRWRRRRAGWREAGGGVVLWGAGSRATTVFNLLGIGEEVVGAVDVNPRRAGTYVAGTGHPVMAPDTLREIRPRLAVVLNPVYVDEVAAMLSGLGLDTAVEPA